jgi:glucokinase
MGTRSGSPVIAVDLGGTNIRVAHVLADGSIAARIKQPTPFDAPFTHALQRLVDSLPAKTADPQALVIGVPGLVNYRTGALEWARNLPDAWLSEISETTLSESLGITVSLASDTDLAALGEAKAGAGREAEYLAYLTISTGLGAAVVAHGRVVRSGYKAFELGNTIFGRFDEPSAPRLALLEEFVSGKAIERHAEQLGLPAKPGQLLELARSGNAQATTVWADLLTMAGIAAANLAHMFVPDTLVVGGSVGTSHPELLDQIEKELVVHGPQGLDLPIPVRRAELGDDSALVGAAWWEAQGQYESTC